MIRLELIGTDGTMWDIRRGEIRLSDAGVRGLYAPTYEESVQSTAILDGQTVSRWKLLPRDVFLPFNIKTSDWRLVTQFLTSLDPHRIAPRGYGLAALAYCTLRVTDSEGAGAVRELQVRFKDDGGYALRHDPGEVDLPPMGLTFVADDPWWYGPEQVSNYSMADSNLPNFFGATGAPSFNIVAPGGNSGVWAVNRGDAEAWPVYEVYGPATFADFWISINGVYRQTSLFHTLLAGQSVTIDTNPARQIALKNDGTILNRNMGADFAPIPVANEDVSYVYIGTRIEGTGRVRARFREPYKRAF